MQQRGQHQGGWVARFIIVAVILAAVLIGGIYFLKTHQNMFSTDKNKPETSSQNDASNSSDTGSFGNSSDDNQKSDTSKNDTNSDSSETKSSSDKDASDTKKSETKTDDLPHTGPATDAFMSILALSALAFATTSYVKSRR